MKKKSIILAATSALAVLTLAACSGDTNKDIATMKGGTITVSDFYDEAKLESSNQSLVQRMIIYKVFNNKYGDKVTDKQVDAEYDKQAKSLGDTFESQLEAAGYTKDTYKEYIRNNLAFEAGLKAHVDITDDDLKTAWKSFHPEVEAQIIKLSSEDEAKDVKKSADDGDDFSKLAKDKSTDTETKEDGGKVKFDSTTTTIPAEVKEAAFKLKDGEVSDVITATNTTSYATEYYVVKMVKNQNKGNDMDKYKDQITEIAQNTLLNDSTFVAKTIGKELKAANVKMKDEDLADILSDYVSAAETKDSTDSSATDASDNKENATDSTKESTETTSSSATDSSEK